VEARITLAESLVGFRRTLTRLDGTEMVLGGPTRRVVAEEEKEADAPSLPSDEAGSNPASRTTSRT